ncbi:MAG TPA: DUF6569 family protein, partial [Ktedonobacterales bacterium]|nr:DUF6569 family protein [Ktedonobacterales bacterium]
MPDDPTRTAVTDPAQVGAAADALRNLLGGVRQGEPLRYGALQLIPLLPVVAPAERQAEYLPLDAALARSLLTVTEQPQATVPELQASSVADVPVIMITGEQVVGGLQNRVLNTTILVGAKTTLRIPVTCVERGRWRHAPTAAAGDESRDERSFSSDEVAYSQLRKAHAKAVTSSLGYGGGHRSDQGMVWQEVSARMLRAGSSSPTDAMDTLYKAPERAEKIQEAVAALPYPAGALGFIAVLGARVTGAELFADPALAAAYWEKLARSYAVEALDLDRRDPTTTEGSADDTAIAGESQ